MRIWATCVDNGHTAIVDVLSSCFRTSSTTEDCLFQCPARQCPARRCCRTRRRPCCRRRWTAVRRTGRRPQTLPWGPPRRRPPAWPQRATRPRRTDLRRQCRTRSCRRRTHPWWPRSRPPAGPRWPAGRTPRQRLYWSWGTPRRSQSSSGRRRFVVSRPGQSLQTSSGHQKRVREQVLRLWKGEEIRDSAQQQGVIKAAIEGDVLLKGGGRACGRLKRGAAEGVRVGVEAGVRPAAKQTASKGHFAERLCGKGERSQCCYFG